MPTAPAPFQRGQRVRVFIRRAWASDPEGELVSYDRTGITLTDARWLTDTGEIETAATVHVPRGSILWVCSLPTAGRATTEPH